MIQINIKIEFFGRARMILGFNSFEITVNKEITNYNDSIKILNYFELEKIYKIL